MSTIGFNLATMPALGAVACMTVLPQNNFQALPPTARLYSGLLKVESPDVPNWNISVADLMEKNRRCIESKPPTPEIGKGAKIQAEFKERAERWEKETAIHSSPSATYLHKDYIAIIGIGRANQRLIVPCILKRMPDTGADWFFALENIAGENPAKDAGDFETAFKAWCRWAEQRGLTRENDGLSRA